MTVDNDNDSEVGRPASGREKRRCPICKQPTEPRWRPFCSQRCADIDLGRWLGEAYRIPAEEAYGEDADSTSGGTDEGGASRS